MNISYRWLKDYVEHDLSPEDLARVLTFQACPIEDMAAVGDDHRLELEVTFNRSDLLSHLGVAREVAAATGSAVTEPAPAPPEDAACPAGTCAGVEVLEPGLCPRYTARVLRGVTIRPSPAWLQERLEAVGLRPVNNVVDVTNYVLYECGQPLHAFDLELLEGRRIVVRRAGAGEMITAINGDRIELSADELVIADAARPVAIAGVMGGLDSEIRGETRDILLESAYFDPVATRRAVRRIGLRSDSSHRFERGVDPARVEWASRRAAQLILEVAGGTLCAGVLDVDAGTLPGPREVELRLARLRRLGGVDIPADDARRLLCGLGMEVVDGADGVLRVAVPTARHEVTREVDLIEEVLRTYGFDKVPLAESVPIAVAPVDPRERSIGRLKDVLVGAGYREVHTLSFVAADPIVDPPLFTDRPARTVQNPVRSETPALRRSLFGPLLEAKRVSLDRAGVRAVKLFEVSTVYLPRAEGGVSEHLMLGMLADDDLLGAKGALAAALDRIGVRDAMVEPVTVSEGAAADLRCDPDAVTSGRPAMVVAPGVLDCFDPLERGAVVLRRGGPSSGHAGRPELRRAGWIGRIGAKAAARFELGRQRPVVALLDLEPVLERASLERSFRPIPPYPEIARDLAAVVERECYVGHVLREAEEVVREEPALRSIELLSVFEGDGQSLERGRKSVAIRLVCQADDRTLTSEEADAVRGKVKRRLADRFAATFRE